MPLFDELRKYPIPGWLAYGPADGLAYIAICEEDEGRAWSTLAECFYLPERLQDGYDAAIAEMKADGWNLVRVEIHKAKPAEAPNEDADKNKWLDFNDVEPADGDLPPDDNPEDESFGDDDELPFSSTTRH
jgi:hypothetical protein